MKRNKLVFAFEINDRKLVIAFGYRLNTFIEKNLLSNVSEEEVADLWKKALEKLDSQRAFSGNVVATSKPRAVLVGNRVHTQVSTVTDLGECTDKVAINEFVSKRREKVASDLAALNAIENEQIADVEALEAAEAKAKAEAAKKADEAKSKKPAKKTSKK